MKAVNLKRGKIGDTLDEMEDESEDSLDLLSPDDNTAGEYLAMQVEEAFGRMEKAMNVQGALILKMVEQAAKGAPPAVVTVETTQAPQAKEFRIKVVRDRNNLISELLVTPIRTNVN